MIGEVVSVADRVVPPSLDVHVAVKLVIALPPLPFAVNATRAELLPRVTPVRVGASGVRPATNELDAADAALSPTALVAMTVQVYARPVERELIVTGEVAPVVDRVRPPLLDRQVTR